MSNSHGRKRSRLTFVGTVLLMALIAMGVFSIVTPGEAARAADGAGTPTPIPTPSASITPVSDLAVVITSPTDGATLDVAQPITFTASVVGGQGNVTKVEYTARQYDMLTLLGSATTAPYSVVWSNPRVGSYTIYAVVYTDTGETANDGIQITVANNPTPVVEITSPANGATLVASTSVTISASASVSSGSITKVDFIAVHDDVVIQVGTATTAPYSVTWDVNVTYIGSYTLYAIAYTNTGQSANDIVGVTIVENPPPTVSITSPADGATFTAPATITVSASASVGSGSITKVVFYAYYYDMGVLIGTDTTAPYSITWDHVLANTYQIRAIATSSAGTLGASSPVDIVVGNGGGGSGCAVTYSMNQWPGGFTGTIRITNISDTAYNGWSLVFDFPGNQQITQGWNGVFSQSGNQVTVTNAAWNGSIQPNQTIYIGFNGSWSGSNPSPTSFELNGVPCNVPVM